MQLTDANSWNMVSLYRDREAGAASAQRFQRQLQFPETFVPKLCIEDILHGHTGCVNRLAWNPEGTMLASGSDDRQVILWHYPHLGQQPLKIDTLHEANIFGVAFLPCTDNRSIVTGAMDKTVQLHQLEHSPLADSRGGGADVQVGRSQAAGGMQNQATTVYNCHRGRVKGVDVEPGNPYLFWSASEDGTVRQFDTRCKDQGAHESKNVLLGVKQKFRMLDLLSLKINKARPYQLAVAANDQFVRIYDRRAMSLGTMDSPAVGTPAVLKMAPPHMCLLNSRKAHRGNATYVDFGAKGDKLIASFHAEQAYAFNIGSSAESSFSTAFQPPDLSRQPFLTRPGYMPEPLPLSLLARRIPKVFSEQAEAAKTEGNRAFFDTDDNAAVWHYTKAIHLAPDSAALYRLRGAALLKREWLGDAYAALQDCERAISLDPTQHKAHTQRISALNALGQLQAARDAAEIFAAQFPERPDDVERCRQSVAEELKARRTQMEADASQRAAVRERRQALMRGHGHSGEEPEQDDEQAEALTRSSNDDEVDYGQEGWLRESDSGGLQRSTSTSRDTLLGFGRGIAGEVHRLRQRFVGHCNVQTDIKEATFMGGNDELVAAGSDDGRVFIYDAETGYPIRALQADEDVVNCVQPHPSLPVLATSGIESVVRLWHPGQAGEGTRLRSIMSLVQHNQEKLKNQSNIFRSVTPRVLAALTQNSELLSMIMAMDRARQDESDMNLNVDVGGGNRDQEVTCRVA